MCCVVFCCVMLCFMLLSFLSVLSVFSLCEVYFFSSSRLFNRATTHPVRNADCAKKSHRSSWIHSGKRRAHTTASYQQDPWAVERCPCRSSFSSRNYRLWEPTLGLFLKDCIPWKGAMLEQLLGNFSTWEGSTRGICERLHYVGGT